MPRTVDRLSRGIRAFNAATSIGVKKKGLSMAVCSTLFWSIIVPSISYGSELGVMRPDEIETIRKFQRYIGRRCQRFPSKSPNFSAYYSLGWLSLDRYIGVKKLLFLKTMAVMKEHAVCKQTLMRKAYDFNNDLEKRVINEYERPIFEILKTARTFGMFDECMRMALNGCHVGKREWSRKVWETAWDWKMRRLPSYINNPILVAYFSR